MYLFNAFITFVPLTFEKSPSVTGKISYSYIMGDDAQMVKRGVFHLTFKIKI